MNSLYIRSWMIKDTLSIVIVKSSSFWLEFKAYQLKWFSLNYPNWRERSKCLSWILKDFVIHWSITCVHNLNALINWFICTCTSKDNFVWGTKFYHRNKWLWPRRKWVPYHSYIDTCWWINIFIDSLLKLWFLQGWK